ncbi:hypothetical protein POM88_029105 [Heracleum sosnowskyi]|uniref:Uncharacterized protein n=1 Tax=Heracleum sosnowskyi TaxID=360622 RepID=A0AAD8HUU6_9APIA|nr:hypothetical protein POM88_029105 [Heracleum sosnowskyi]
MAISRHHKEFNGIGKSTMSDAHRAQNSLARFLMVDRAYNRTRLVVFRRPFGRVREIWHLDMGLGLEIGDSDLIEKLADDNRFLIGIYSCTKCPRIFPYPKKKFRLCIICSDQTGSMVVIFPDSEVSRFMDKTVVDIQSECLKEEDEENFPEILRMFLNKKYTSTLQITEDNINRGSTVYEAKEIMESDEITDSFDPHEKSVMEIQDHSQLKDLEEEYTKNETPQTCNSSNMKKRERTNVQPVLYDDNENVEVKASKNVKKEKKNRIHAFIPGLCSEQLEEKISVENVHSIKNFIVQPYKTTYMYKCLRNEKQLIFSKDTHV